MECPIDVDCARLSMCFRVRSDSLLVFVLSCGFLNQCRHFFWTRLVDRVAGTLDFDHMALGACGVPAFEVRVDGSVLCRYGHPAWLSPPCCCGDGCVEIRGRDQYLGVRSESGFIGGQIGRKILAILCGIKVVETVRRPFYC